MRNILIIFFTLGLVNLSYADHKLNFNDARDIVTCSNGAYVLSKSSTQKEILKYCQPIGATRNRGSAGPVLIEFWGDNSARVKCRFNFDSVRTCKIKD